MVGRELVMHAPLPRLADLCASGATLARVTAVTILRLAILPVDLVRLRARARARAKARARARAGLGLGVGLGLGLGFGSA